MCIDALQKHKVLGFLHNLIIDPRSGRFNKGCKPLTVVYELACDRACLRRLEKLLCHSQVKVKPQRQWYELNTWHICLWLTSIICRFLINTIWNWEFTQALNLPGDWHQQALNCPLQPQWIEHTRTVMLELRESEETEKVGNRTEMNKLR